MIPQVNLLYPNENSAEIQSNIVYSNILLTLWVLSILISSLSSAI